MVDHAPSIAVFHLKRFKNDVSCVEKIDKHVDFPLEIDLKPYTSGDQDDMEAYILFYAKNGTPWFSTFLETEKTCLDSIVSISSPKSVLETANQSSDSSPSRETNIISEVFKEDQREALGICELSSNNSREDVVGEVKNDLNIEKKSSPSPSRGDNLVILSTSPKSVLDNVDQNSVSSPIMETNISTDVNEEDRRDAVGSSRMSVNDCRYRDEVNEAKDDLDSLITPSSSAFIVYNSALFNTSPKSVIDHSDHIYESPSNIETKIRSHMNKENRGDDKEISMLHFDDRRHENTVNEAKDDCKNETRLSSSVSKGGNCNHRGLEFTKTADFNSSTSWVSLNSVGISRLPFDDCTPEDRVGAAKDDSGVENKLYPSTLRRRRVGKSAAVNSSICSAKRCAIPRDHPMSDPSKKLVSNDRQRKKDYKVAAVNDNREDCFGNKRRKIEEPNLVSQRRAVAPGRFR